jgi:hypothetical protein
MSEQSLLLEIEALAKRVSVIERALERSGTSLNPTDGTIPVEVESTHILWNYIRSLDKYQVTVPAHCPRCDKDVRITTQIGRFEKDGEERVLICLCGAHLRAVIWHNLLTEQEVKRGNSTNKN